MWCRAAAMQFRAPSVGRSRHDDIGHLPSVGTIVPSAPQLLRTPIRSIVQHPAIIKLETVTNPSNIMTATMPPACFQTVRRSLFQTAFTA